jgi:hypothetical protein
LPAAEALPATAAIEAIKAATRIIVDETLYIGWSSRTQDLFSLAVENRRLLPSI